MNRLPTETKIRVNNRKLLLIPVLLITAALVSGVAIYWILFWFVLLWFFMSFIWLWYTAKNVDIDMELAPEVVERKESVDLKIKVFNDSFLPFPHSFFQWDSFSQLEEEGTFQIVDGNNMPDRDEAITDMNLLGGWQRHYQVLCPRRGKHTIGPLKIVLSSPFGIIELEILVEGTKQVKVLPRVLSLNGDVKLAASEPQGTRKNQYDRPMDYTEPHDLRPFMHGDPPKLINWKVSAKHNDLYIRRVENTGEMKVLLCLELERKLYQSGAEQDWLMECTLALMGYFLNAGIKTGILTFDQQPQYFIPSSQKKALSFAQHFFLGLTAEKTKESLLNYILNGNWDINEYQIIWITPVMTWAHVPKLAQIETNAGKLDVLVGEPEAEDALASQYASYYLSPDNTHQINVREVKLG